MGLKKLVKKYKKMMNNPFKGNIKDRVGKVKDFMAESQKASPSSKYLGVKLYPGMVKSEQERREDAEAAGKAIETQTAATAAATAAETAEKERQAARDRSSMPSKAEQDLIAKRRAARKRSGRSSTILTDDTLG